MAALGFYTTATEALRGADLSGKSAIVTGDLREGGGERRPPLCFAGRQSTPLLQPSLGPPDLCN